MIGAKIYVILGSDEKIARNCINISTKMLFSLLDHQSSSVLVKSVSPSSKSYPYFIQMSTLLTDGGYYKWLTTSGKLFKRQKCKALRIFTLPYLSPVLSLDQCQVNGDSRDNPTMAHFCMHLVNTATVKIYPRLR
ncbi:bedf0bc5-a0fa-48b0-91a0-67c2277b5930 [Sclerotinia trifoliorum]|uniref:Bedf0bc5-a0fa-48b0-91a0-67c2277b5930 n=1 Tax=Sclerotinia trifoliorum TaxID=28548 RepID=A0A8H2VWQ3_9HELO|nr:bedf0bc5-a0fa-48b0-91a0-67c2277b5930 [Sclerotinia trifoliorum]